MNDSRKDKQKEWKRNAREVTAYSKGTAPIKQLHLQKKLYSLEARPLLMDKVLQQVQTSVSTD
jgi:hypothetical protein